MRAVVQQGYGSSEVLTLGERPAPTPGTGQVVVRVHAAAIDRGTWHLMTGEPLLMRPAFGFRGLRNPVPGRDVAGTVTAVGPGVVGFAVGDAVVGTAWGSLAEYALADADRLALLPDAVPVELAAALPVSGQTALAAVVDVGKVQAGQRVLVIGASGGVGSYAVQLATAADAEVTGICSAAKADLVRELGATHVLDRGAAWRDEPGGPYDLIVDIAGDTPLRELRRMLTRTGTLVVVGTDGGRLTGGLGRPMRAALLSPFLRQRLVMLASKERGVDVARLLALVAAGTLRPAVARTYPLAEVRTAMDDLVAGRVTGKAVLLAIPDVTHPGVVSTGIGTDGRRPDE